MKFYQRIISICMSLLLLLGALPMQVLAADLREASEHTVSMSNRYIKVVVNKDNGRFAIRTADGQPLRKNDQNTTLTFDEDDTSFTTFRITDGTYKGEYIFGNGYELNGGNYLSSSLSAPVVSTADDGTQTMTTTWTLTLDKDSGKTIVIDQKLRLNASEATDTSGMVFVDYDVKNNTGAQINVGTRVLLDTKVGANDGPAFQNGTEQEATISVEQSFEGSAIKNYYMMRDSGSYTNPLATSVYAYGFNNVGNDDATVERANAGTGDFGNLVDKIVVGHWAHLANAKFDVEADPNLNFTVSTNDYGTADSALAYFWNDDAIASGGKQSYRVVYGIGEILLDDSEFQISFIDQKTQLETNDAKTAYLSNGIFDITVQVQCSEQSTLSHAAVTATLTLENGLSFVETKNGQVVYNADGTPKKMTGPEEYTQTTTYTKSKTSTDQDTNYFAAGDITVFRYKVVAEGKAWPTTKEYLFSVTSDELKNAAASKRENKSYAVNEATCTRSDFILLPAIGETQRSRAFSLAPEQAYFEDEKIISVGVTNFGAYTQGTREQDASGYWYPDRTFDVYLLNVLTGERYLVDPGDITLVDRDGANGMMNIDYRRGTRIEADNASPYSVLPVLNANDPTVPVGKYAVEVYYRGGDEELRDQLSFVSSQQIDVNMSQEARLRTGGFLTVARRYQSVNNADYQKYSAIIDALNYASYDRNVKNVVSYTAQPGRIPYYEVKILRDENELAAYKREINSVTSFNDELGWTTNMDWANGEILLEVKGKVKEQDGGYLVDTSVEPAVINRTVTYKGSDLTLTSEILTDSFGNNEVFRTAYAKYVGALGQDYARLTEEQQGKINNDLTLRHWVLAGNGKTSVSGSKYTFYKDKWNIDFYDGFAKSLFLQDRLSDYSDRFDDSNVYNVSSLTASQEGFRQHCQGLTGEQYNPLVIMADTDVYFNQLGLHKAYDYNPGGIQLSLEEYRLASYHDDYRLLMGGHVNFFIFDGTVDEVAFDAQGYYGMDTNCGFDIWKNIGILQAVGKYYSEGYDQSKAETSNQIGSGGRAVEAGAAMLIRNYRNNVLPRKDDIFAMSSKMRLPILGGFYVGFTFKEVDNGMVLPDCFAFQYFAKSNSKDVAGAAGGAAQRMALPGIQIGPNLYMTRVRAAVRNLADTVYGIMTDQSAGSLPLQLAGGISVSMPMGLGTVMSRVAIIGNIDMLLKMTGLKITGSAELELWLISLPLINMAEFQVQWCSPAFVSAKIAVDIFNLGVLVGKGSIFIGEREDGDFDFDAYISAAVMIPEKVPVVGGLTLSKAYFGVNLERITGGFTIIPLVLVNLEYFWGGGIDDINFWVETDGTPKEEALAYLVHTDEESGQQSVLSIGKNIAYVATSDYDPENAGQKLAYRSTEGADALLIYRSAGLGGITVDDETYDDKTVYTVPVGEKVYNADDPANALIEIEYLDEQPVADSVTLNGETYTLAPYQKDSKGEWITPDDLTSGTAKKLYYFTQERDMDGTIQKLLYITVPFELMDSDTELALTLDQTVDMALLRVGRGAAIDNATLTRNGNALTMSADVTNVKDGSTVKFFLTKDGSGSPAATETINGKTVTVDDLGSMGMPVGSVTLSKNTGTQTVSLTIDDINDCTILDQPHVNLNELLESGDYYLRAVLDNGNMQAVKQTENAIRLTDPKSPEAVSDVSLALGGNGQLCVSFKPDDSGNVADAFVLNFYDKDGNDWAAYTDLLIERADFEEAPDGTLSYTLGKWTETEIENVDDDGNSLGTKTGYVGFQTGADTAYKAKVKAVCSEQLDGGTKYHYSALSDYATVPEALAAYRVDSTTIRLPEPVEPGLTVSGAETYYKHGDGQYDTSAANGTFAYYSLATNQSEPELTVSSDTAVTLRVYNNGEPMAFCVGESGDKVTETVLAANSAATLRLQGFDGTDSTTNVMLYARNETTRDSASKTVRVVTDYTAPTLYIDSPVNGTASENGSVSFSGMTNATDSVVTVYVDGSATGTKLTVDSDGNLSGSVALNTANPTAQLRVEAKDAAGNSNAAVITVQNGGYEVAQNIVLRTYKLGSTTKVETVGRFANGRNADGSVAYVEKPVEGATYSTYRGDATAAPDGTITFAETDAGIIEATYNTPDGAKLTAMTVVRRDSTEPTPGTDDPTPGTDPTPGGGGGGASGGGGGASGGGGGGASGGVVAPTDTVKSDASRTTVNNRAVDVIKTNDIVSIDATGSGEKSVRSELPATGYAVSYTPGSALSVDTPIFKAALDAQALGSSGTLTVKESVKPGGSAVSALSVDLGGSGELSEPAKVSVAIPDTVSVSDVTAVILRDSTGKTTPLPFVLNMIGDKAFVDVLLPEEGEIILECCKTTFSDVTPNDWSYEEIMAAAAREIVNGVADGVFDRTSDCTRSSFATILMRTGGMMTRETDTVLPDVPKTAWDYRALAIAKDLGVITGFEDGTIRGGNPVSRTEAMVMVGRFLGVMGIAQQLTDSEVEEQLKTFTDGASVPAWARSSVALCVKAGIINGMGGAINGGAMLNREQCAAIANRLNRVIVETLLAK